MSSAKLEIITPNEMFYDGEVEILMAETVDGDEGYMPNHGRLQRFHRRRMQTG